MFVLKLFKLGLKALNNFLFNNHALLEINNFLLQDLVLFFFQVDVLLHL